MFFLGGICFVSVGAINEVIEDKMDGYIAENDIEFTDRVIELLNNDDLLMEMSKRAYENYGKKFSNETTKKRLITILETYKEG